MEDSLPITRFLVLGTLETLINQALEQEPRAQERLHALHGTAVRVRAERPSLVLYLLIYEDGIEILSDYEGHVDIRIRGPLGGILQWLLSPNSALPDDDHIRILGKESQVNLLTTTISEFSLWNIVRHWLENHVHLTDILGFLRREDPRWLARLQQLPDQVGQIARELSEQRLLQEEILTELKSLKRGMRRERQRDLLSLLFGLGLLMAAFATHSGELLPVSSLTIKVQALLFASVGLTVILSRLLFGHRYD